MKNVLIALSLVAAVACTSAPEVPEEPIPAVEYEAGFTFDTPCETHGSHVNTVLGSRLVRVYEISVDDGTGGEATGESIARVLEMIEFMNSIQVVPVDPAAAEPVADDPEESR